LGELGGFVKKELKRAIKGKMAGSLRRRWEFTKIVFPWYGHSRPLEVIKGNQNRPFREGLGVLRRTGLGKAVKW